MTDLIAARCVFALHLGFLAFVVCGGLLVAWRPRVWAWLHLPALAWGVWIVASHGLCPLTTIENSLLDAAGVAGYDGGFIDRYLVPLLYPPGLTPTVQTGLAVLLAVWNLGWYALGWRRRGT
ncbi:MAG: hypothetical protein JWQ90_5508 [Hydrocarboniphaga sp.]|uniref:DUF2784 domain-containing protein n=1 Tax=Hydrocarboniphaga sp. TaxID=2033016 RepID=UPI00262B1DFE|nr:DUF2784 domain-containing protein [Hydrocarboniphaga sp.]MDB5973058.1 hypothetical protein [Hydrocarboniphaga sp.]